MVSSITQKFSKALDNQGDKSLAQGQNSESSLFDQFSEILDKIATSLNHVKRKGESDSLNDIAAALSQAAAQQVSVQQRVQIQVERKAPAPQGDSREASEVRRPGGSEKVAEQVAASAEVPVTASVPTAAGEKAVPAPQAAGEQKNAARDSSDKSATQPDTQSPDADNSQAPARDLQPVAEVIEVVAPEVVAVEAPAGEVAAVDVEAEVVPVETAAPAADAPAVPVQAVTAPVTEAVEAPVDAAGAQQVASVQAEVSDSDSNPAETPVTEAEGHREESAVRIAQPSEQDFIEVPVSPDKKAADAAVDMRQILLQSAQALVNQALLSSSSQQLMESSVSQRLVAGIQAAQGSVSASAAAQGTASPLLQSKGTQEKNASRELSRPAALRTMERVESALKEVARSKDGKTISLRLDPPSLGSVKIDVTLKDGQLHARFIAESPQVNALLREQSHELQQILRRAGVTADRVTVSVAGEAAIDLSTNFQSFDQQGAQQFEESAQYGAALGTSLETGVSVVSTPASAAPPVDHWVA